MFNKAVLNVVWKFVSNQRYEYDDVKLEKVNILVYYKLKEACRKYTALTLKDVTSKANTQYLKPTALITKKL